MRVHATSLGCPKNLVDSERLLSEALDVLSATTTDDPSSADLVLLNTCAFIREAEEEAVEKALSLKEALQSSRGKLVILGCLPARHKEELKELSELGDLVIPFGDYEGFGERLKALFPKNIPTGPGE
jgi:ribosomal protein S12 methylthiotransferase